MVSISFSLIQSYIHKQSLFHVVSAGVLFVLSDPSQFEFVDSKNLLLGLIIYFFFFFWGYWGLNDHDYLQVLSIDGLLCLNKVVVSRFWITVVKLLTTHFWVIYLSGHFMHYTQVNERPHRLFICDFILVLVCC